MKKAPLTLPWAKIDNFIGNCTSTTLTANRPCPICGSLDYRTLLIFDDFQFFSDSAKVPKRTQIRNVQCQHCYAIYLDPCYSKVGFHYLFAEAGRSYGSAEGRPKEQIQWMGERGLLDDGKVFLDAGCYEGRFLSFLPKSVRRLGVDIDAPAIMRGQERYGIYGVELIHGAFENFQCPVSPDVISMFHVLEHLANPLEVLGHLLSISHAGTRLIIEVPVIEHGATNDINGFFSVQHMTHFSINSLSYLMSQAGWDVVERQQMPDYNGHRILCRRGLPLREVIKAASDHFVTLEYLAHWYNNLTKIFRLIESWPKVSHVVVWGSGIHTELMYQVTQLFHLNAQCEYLIVDGDPLKHGKSWRGLTIMPPESLGEVDWSDCLLIISSYGSQESIAQAAEKMGVPHTAVHRLYDHVKAY